MEKATKTRRSLKLRIKLCAFVGLGPGKIDLLEAVERCGSITAAAKDQGMSYRRAWLLIDEMNRAFANPVVEASPEGPKGRGTALSDTGREVVAIYREALRKTEEAVREELGRIALLLADEPRPPKEHVRRKRCDASARPSGRWS
jgi:molybdate transport system regulatory protein